MKASYILMLLVLAGISLFAESNKQLIGRWELIEFTLMQRKQTAVSDEKTLRDAGAVWNLEFAADGTFRQEFNMRKAEMTMETQSGKWQTKNDSLFIELQIDSITSNLNYSYLLLDNVVVLTLENPGSTDKIVTRFRRKY